jgi:hypothetical protein
MVHGGPSAPSSPELGLRPLRGSRSPAKGAGRRRRGRGTGWRPHLVPAGDEGATRRRGVVAVAGARWRRAWTTEERRWGGGWLSCSIARSGVPFIGPGRQGGGRQVVMAAVVSFQVAAGYGGEAKRRRRQLREGKGGGGREASGPVRRRWPEGMGGHAGVRSRGSGGCSCSGKKKAKATFGSLRFLKRET